MNDLFDQWYGIVRNTSKDYGLALMADNQNVVVLPAYRAEDGTIYYDECAEDDKKHMDNVRLEDEPRAFPELCYESMVKPGEVIYECYVVACEDSLEVWSDGSYRRTKGNDAISDYDQKNILDHMCPRHLQRDRYREVLLELCRNLLEDMHTLEPAGLFQKPDHVSMVDELAPSARQKERSVCPDLYEGSGELQKLLAAQPVVPSDLPATVKKEQGKEKADAGDREYDG